MLLSPISGGYGHPLVPTLGAQPAESGVLTKALGTAGGVMLETVDTRAQDMALGLCGSHPVRKGQGSVPRSPISTPYLSGACPLRDFQHLN